MAFTAPKSPRASTAGSTSSSGGATDAINADRGNLGLDRDQPDRDTGSSRTLSLGGSGGTGRGPMKLRLAGNKREGIVSPRIRSRRKSRSFRVR